MLSRLKFTLRSTLIYSLGSIGIKFIGLILLPIYTEKLTTEQYGMWSILEITSQILLITFGLRLSTALLRFYASEKDNHARGKVVFTAFWATLASVLIFNLTTQFFTGSFSQLFFDTPEFAMYFRWLFIWTSFEIFNQLALDLIRVKEKPGLFITVTITKFLLALFAIIYLIVFRDMGIEGIILGQLAGSVIVMAITLPFILREMRWQVDLHIFSAMFRYGFPLIFSGISSFILAVGDRYLVKIYLDYHEVGVYSLSYKISNLIKIVFVQAFQLGFLPIAFNMYDKPNAERFFSKIFTYYVFVVMWAGLALSVFSGEIIHTFSSSSTYYEAARYIPWLTLAISLFGIQNFFMIGIHYAKKTRFIALITFISMVVNVILNLLLIPRFGLYGAAFSYIIAGGLMSVLNYRRAQMYYPINFEFKKVGLIMSLSFVLFALSILTGNLAMAIRLILKSLIIFVFPIILFLLKFYEPNEVKVILSIWRKWRNPLYWYRNLKELSLKQSVDSSDL